MGFLLEDGFQGRVNLLPLGEQLLENERALFGDSIEALVALVFFAPLALEQALRLKAAEERVEGAFIDGEAAVGEGFALGIAVLLGAQSRQDGQHEATAAEFEAEVFEGFGGHRRFTI